MEPRLNMTEARALLPLLRSISTELAERRAELAQIEAMRDDLAHASDVSPEGLTRALQDLEVTIRDERRAIESCLSELSRLGLEVPSTEPLVIYIPGLSDGNEVMFYWTEGDEAVEDEGRPFPPELHREG